MDKRFVAFDLINNEKGKELNLYYIFTVFFKIVRLTSHGELEFIGICPKNLQTKIRNGYTQFIFAKSGKLGTNLNQGLRFFQELEDDLKW